MRIALLTCAVPWDDQPTNGLYNVAQCAALNSLGHCAEIFSIAPCLPAWMGRLHQAALRQLNRPEHYCVDGVGLHTLRVPFAYTRFVRQSLAPACPRIVAQTFKQAAGGALTRALARYEPDLILAHGMLPWCEAAEEIARELGAKLGYIEHSYEDVMRIRRGSALHRFYVDRAASADRVFTVSGSMSRHLEALGVRQVETLRNGVALIDGLVHSKPRTAERPFTILCAGQFIERKGHEVLLRAFARLEDASARLRVVGMPPAKLSELAAALGVADRVEWLPVMPNRALIEEMSRADLFALPSWSEAFGLVYLEALGAGTPVVMTRDCGAAEHIEPGTHGWVVEPRCTDDLARALSKALCMPRSRLLEMGRAGHQLASSCFRWSQNARAVADAFAA